MRIIADRRRALPAPPPVVWGDLTAPRRDGDRAWLRLLPDEVPPRVLASLPPRTLTWSSLWTRHPELVVRFDCLPHAGGTMLHVVVAEPRAGGDAGLSDAAIGHVRHRVNHLLFADLRATYGQ